MDLELNELLTSSHSLLKNELLCFRKEVLSIEDKGEMQELIIKLWEVLAKLEIVEPFFDIE